MYNFKINFMLKVKRLGVETNKNVHVSILVFSRHTLQSTIFLFLFWLKLIL